MLEIVPVRQPADMRVATALFRDYAASLDIDLSYQGFDAELAAMPGLYAPPLGELLLARDTMGTSLGCVGLRPMSYPGLCEMKRLYVCPTGRGKGVGRALIEAIIGVAARIGFDEMRLDTLPAMAVARALYCKAGFAEIGAYYDTPVAGTVFLAKRLISPAKSPIDEPTP